MTGKMSFHEMMKVIRNTKKHDWIVAKLVCKNCRKVYEYSERKKCRACGGELEVVWDYASNWRERIKGWFIKEKT